jgi:MotA/TolQ/ExbB proton channel family
MHDRSNPPGNIILLRGACLWLLMALILAWCMVGLAFNVPYMSVIFPGKFTRVLQGHIDFLLMTALILGFYATKTRLPWHVRWAMVVGAFTNSSLFVMQAMFPVLDSPNPPDELFPKIFLIYLFSSLILTSYGFGRGSVLVLKSTFANARAEGAVSQETAGSGDGSTKFLRSPDAVRRRARFFTPARLFALRRRLVALIAPSAGHDALLMWMIFTGLTFLVFILLWFFGLAQAMLDADRTYISLVIVLLYVAISLHCLWRAVIVSRETATTAEVSRLIKAQSPDNLPRGAVSTHIRDLKTKAEILNDGRLDQTLLLRVLASRLRGSNDFGVFASDTLMKLGLFGTIVGFIMMLAPISGLDTENSEALKSSMSAMSDGMAVAMYTTLTGLVGSVLVRVQYSFVESATARIFSSAVGLTEVYVLSALSRDRGASS